ncbi:unnamed protein product [Ophioblennius macclurei]
MAAGRRYADTRSRMEAAARQDVCRHFISGTCRFGSSCYFRHELPAPPSSQLCRYFHKGTCWYGERCRYLHVLQPEMLYGVTTAAAAADRRGSAPSVLPPSAAPSAERRRRSEPVVLRSEETSRRGRNASRTTLNTSRPPPADGGVLVANTKRQERGAHLDSARNSNLTQHAARQDTNEVPPSSQTSEDGAAAAAAAAASSGASGAQSEAEAAQAFLQSRDVTCGICMDKVYDKSNPGERVFGILPNCNHPFCLDCIKTWRKTRDLTPNLVKTCPQCRVSSAFYVPSKFWVEGEEKETLIAAFREKLRKKRCLYYSRYGYCPFRSECLHRHDKPPAHRLTRYQDDDDDVDLLGFVIAMTVLSLDEDGDLELSFVVPEEDRS